MIRLLALIWCVLAAAPALSHCRQALALGLDVSGSVDSHEYQLQVGGLVAALNHPDVRRALLTMPSAPVRLLVYEWSGQDDQRTLVNWTEITDAGALADVSATLRAVNRRPASTGTALGEAIQVGARHLRAQPGCWKHTLDISGDGKNNIGPHPREVIPALAGQNIVVNGLVIGADAPSFGDTRQVEISELSSYFNLYVRSGPDSFVETALGFEDFEEVMTRKLLRELEGLVLSRLDPRTLGAYGPRSR